MRIVRKQFLNKVLSGTADANFHFDDLRSLLNALGFDERVKGSHHIFKYLHETRSHRDSQPATTRLSGKAVPSQASSDCDCSV